MSDFQVYVSHLKLIGVDWRITIFSDYLWLYLPNRGKAFSNT